MKFIIVVLILLTSACAKDDSLTCKEKKQVLNALQSENISLLEKATLGLYDQGLFIGHTREEERLREEKIRVLKLELQSCSNLY